MTDEKTMHMRLSNKYTELPITSLFFFPTCAELHGKQKSRITVEI